MTHLYRIALLFVLLFFQLHSVQTQAQVPLTLLRTVPLPQVTGGDFDHFAVDEKGSTLYVVSEVYASIEVFDLKSGNHLQSILGKVKSPRKIVFLPEKNYLLVADAGAACVHVFDIRNFHEVTSVPLPAGPDAGVYDAQKRVFYVGSNGKAEGKNFSFVSVISVDSFKVVARVQVPANTLKTIVVDAQSKKLYVSMRDTNQVAVIDTASNSLGQVWSENALHTDSAMALDTLHHRLFVGNRKPGQLVVFDEVTGKPVAELPIGDTSDDITYDPASRRIYVATADGVDVIAQEDADHYLAIQHVDTLGGKTAILVPSLHRYFVVHSKGEKAG